jgi:hypothetical protein
VAPTVAAALSAYLPRVREVIVRPGELAAASRPSRRRLPPSSSSWPPGMHTSGLTNVISSPGSRAAIAPPSWSRCATRMTSMRCRGPRVRWRPMPMSPRRWRRWPMR